MSSIRNLKENPFATYSAEEDIEYLKSIYYEPRYYRELRDNAINGSSRILVGQRGLGKSATIHFLFNDLKERATLPLLITRYDGIPLVNNENYFLYKIMQSLSNEVALHLFRDPSRRRKLNSTHKKRLAFFIELFYDPETAKYYYEKAKEIKKAKRRHFFCLLHNRFFKTVNLILDGVANFGSDIIRRSIGLDGVKIQNAVREYFKELKLPEIKNARIETVASWDKERLKSLLEQIIEIANTIGYKSIVVLFDKIDEFKDVNSDVNKVADFAKDVLQDTELLYTKNLSIIFSLWSDVKRTLNKQNVRLDKFKDIEIEWQYDELERLIDKRLYYYSVIKSQAVTLETLIPNDLSRHQVLELADYSPRSLIRLLSELYYQEEGDDVVNFSPGTLSKGLLKFCQNFDYYSLQSNRIGGKSDYYQWINKVLLIKRAGFTYKDVANTFNIKENIANKYIGEMLKLDLIKESIMPDVNGERMFEVVDPRIKFLMSRGVTELK